MGLTNAQIDAMDDKTARDACRGFKISPAGKTLADVKRALKSALAGSQGKSTPANPTLAAKTAAAKAPAPAAAPKAAKAAPAPVIEQEAAQPDFAALLAEIKTTLTMMGQQVSELEAALSGGVSVEEASVEEAPPAAEEGNIEPEAAAEEGGSLTHEFIDAAGEEYAGTFREMLVEAGYAEADLAACDFATLQATLHEYLTGQGVVAAEMEEEPIPEPDIAARTALFAASGHALPDNLDVGSLEIGMECVICAPEDPGFLNAAGQPMLYNATVQGVTEDQTKIQVALINEAGDAEAADVPPTHLYVPPPPPAPKPVAKPLGLVKKPVPTVAAPKK